MATPLPPIPHWPDEEKDVPEEAGAAAISISAEDSQKLHTLANEAGIPIKSVLLTVHLKAMSIITGKDDVVTGMVFNGRPETVGGEKEFGLFLNTLPVRFRIPPGEWIDLIHAVFRLEREIMPHRRFPMPEIMKRQKRGRLFDTVFNFTHFHAYENLESLEEKDVAVLGRGGFGKVSLPISCNFQLSLGENKINAQLDFDTRLYGKARMEAYASFYAGIVAAIAADPRALHHYHHAMTPEEILLLADWNRTRSPLPEESVHHMFERHAAQHPDAVALVSDAMSLTFQDLNERANQLAWHLIEAGVGPDRPVGLLIDRTAEMVVGILAILKAGGAFLPMDPAYPRERLAYMMTDAHLSLVLTRHDLTGLIPEAPFVLFDRDHDQITSRPVTNPAVPVLLEHLAYVIYTSGSTGRPKGVLVPHLGFANLVTGQCRAFEITPGDRVIQLASFSFDAAVSEVFMAIAAGATLYLSARENIMPGPDLQAYLEQQRISVMTITPSSLNAMSEAELPDLRLIISAGEACSPDLVARWSPGRTFYNAYGPTEATVWSSGGFCQPDGGVPPLGKPATNTHLYLLNQRLQPVSTGVEGELYIGGVGITRGYPSCASLSRCLSAWVRSVCSIFSASSASRSSVTFEFGEIMPRASSGALA